MSSSVEQRAHEAALAIVCHNIASHPDIHQCAGEIAQEYVDAYQAVLDGLYRAATNPDEEATAFYEGVAMPASQVRAKMKSATYPFAQAGYSGALLDGMSKAAASWKAE